MRQEPNVAAGRKGTGTDIIEGCAIVENFRCGLGCDCVESIYQ